MDGWARLMMFIKLMTLVSDSSLLVVKPLLSEFEGKQLSVLTDLIEVFLGAVQDRCHNSVILSTLVILGFWQVCEWLQLVEIAVL